MAEPLRLRSYQKRGIEIFHTLPEPRRFFFTWDMGAGKTLGALSVAKAHDRKKVIIVCPAMVRGVWLSTARALLPDRRIGSLEHGRERKALTREQRANRDAAFNADVLVTSYDLLGHIPAEGWDFIILDEFHNLRSHLSKQSRMVRWLFKANPKAWALGLSGTPIPNEASQLWNPVDTFFPGRWGRQTNPKYVPYGFLKKFCKWEDNEDDRFPGKFYGLREDKRGELSQMFGSVSLRVKQEDFAKFLPERFVQALPMQKVPHAKKIAKSWATEAAEETAHIGIYTHLRDTARDIYREMQSLAPTATVHFIDGSTPPAIRDHILAACRQSVSSCLVSTTHALNEGISLSFQKAALIVEWTTDVAKVTQFIGRFGRQDSVDMSPTRIQVVVGPNDVAACETLTRRINDINSIVGSTKASNEAQSVFAPEEMSADVFEQELQAMAEAHEARQNLWGAGEDDDDDE